MNFRLHRRSSQCARFNNLIVLLQTLILVNTINMMHRFAEEYFGFVSTSWNVLLWFNIFQSETCNGTWYLWPFFGSPMHTVHIAYIVLFHKLLPCRFGINDMVLFHDWMHTLEDFDFIVLVCDMKSFYFYFFFEITDNFHQLFLILLQRHNLVFTFF